MQFGKNKGCDFLNKKCIEEGVLNPKFTNEFFYNIYSSNIYDTSCSSNRQSRTYHVFYVYDSLPEHYRYFSEDNYGGWASADYCTVSVEDSNGEGNSIYYVGHCSTKGSGEYGSHIKYKNSKIYKSSDIKHILGEQNSDNSFCVLSSLISNIENNEQYSDTIRAVCYQMVCSERSLTIQINNDFIVCPRAG